MQGLLLINKPVGWTSFDVVNYIRKIVAAEEGKKPKNVKVGHTGTLDPLATGLLVVLVGKEYTRRAAEWSKLDKTYEVTMRLGETSTTGDDEGAKTTVSDRVPMCEELEAALEKWTGDIMQTPPVYSAMKVGGVRAYKLARAGKAVVLEPRPARVYSSGLSAYDYPAVQFTSRVSSGTYIRALVEDIGKALGTGAYMAGLRRTTVGSFDISAALEVQGITATNITQNLLTF